MEVQNIETLNLIQFPSVKAPDRVIKTPVTDDEIGRTVDCNIYHPKYGYKGKIVTRKKGVLSYSRAEYKISYTDPVTGNTILCQHDLQLLCCEEDGTFTNKDGIKMRFIDLVEHQTRLAEKKNDFEEIYKREIETKGLEGKEFSDDVFKDELINYLGKLIVDCKKVAAYDEVNAGGSYIEILSVADRFKNWLNTITILHSVPFIGELFSKHLTISTKIKEAYYSLVPQPTKSEDVPLYYKGNLSYFNQPYRAGIYGAYPLMKQWEMVDRKMKEADEGNQGFSEWKRGKVFEAMREYAKGFQIGYNNFLKDIIDNKDNLSNSEKVRLQKIKDYVFNRWNNEPGFSESDGSKTGNPFSNWFEDGKEGGYYYRAWYLILENHLAFAPLFEGKAAGIELNNKKKTQLQSPELELPERFNGIKDKFYSDNNNSPSKIQIAAMIELLCTDNYFGKAAKPKNGKNPVPVWKSIAVIYFGIVIIAELESSKKGDRKKHIQLLKKYVK